jgi:hypothetical protein
VQPERCWHVSSTISDLASHEVDSNQPFMKFGALGRPLGCLHSSGEVQVQLKVMECHWHVLEESCHGPTAISDLVKSGYCANESNGAIGMCWNEAVPSTNSDLASQEVDSNQPLMKYRCSNNATWVSTQSIVVPVQM